MATFCICSSNRERGDILIVKPDFGRWCLPGGEINLGEGVADGLKRELLEETGYEIILENGPPIYFKDNFFYAPDIDEYYQSLIMVFKAKINGNKKDKMKFDNEEIKEVKWVNLDEANKLDKNFILSESIEKIKN